MNSNTLLLTVLVAATTLVGCASQTASKGGMGPMSCSCENCKMMADGKTEKEGGMGMMKMNMMGAETKPSTTTAPATQPQDHTAHH